MEEENVKKETKTTKGENVEKKEVKKETKKTENKKEATPVTKKEETKKDSKTVETKKKSDISKKDKKKSNKGTIIAIILVIVLVVAIVLYMAFMMDSPKKAVNNMFNEAKLTLATENVLSNLIDDEDGTQEIQDAIFANLSWKVLSETKEGDTATVEVEVTNKDFKSIINNVYQKAVRALLVNGENIGEENAKQYLLEELQNNEIENITNTYTITLQKQDGKWKVSEETDLVNMLLPGFNEAIEVLN